MEFHIADSFVDGLNKLTEQEQKLVKIAVFDFQQNPRAPGRNFKRLQGSQNREFWSARVNNEIRIIMHWRGASLLLCFVGHHDLALRWAVNRRAEVHPKTGAITLVKIEERVEESLVSYGDLATAAQLVEVGEFVNLAVEQTGALQQELKEARQQLISNKNEIKQDGAQGRVVLQKELREGLSEEFCEAAEQGGERLRRDIGRVRRLLYWVLGGGLVQVGLVGVVGVLWWVS